MVEVRFFLFLISAQLNPWRKMRDPTSKNRRTHEKRWKRTLKKDWRGRAKNWSVRNLASELLIYSSVSCFFSSTLLVFHSWIVSFLSFSQPRRRTDITHPCTTKATENSGEKRLQHANMRGEERDYHLTAFKGIIPSPPSTSRTMT